MSDDQERKQDELKKIQKELEGAGLSRRNFLNRLSAVGVGFGAALALGVRKADALSKADAGVKVTSTNPVVDDILAEGKEAQAGDAGKERNPDDPRLQLAQYGRLYRRYRRVYRRYRRIYRRYARFYRRIYVRF